MLEAPLTEVLYLGVQLFGDAMIVFEMRQFLDHRIEIRVRELIQTRKERNLFVGGVLRGRVAEIGQRRFEGRTVVARKGLVDDLRDAIEDAEKHFDTPVAIGEESGGIGKTVSFVSDLNWHLRIHLLRSLNGAPFFMPVRMRSLRGVPQGYSNAE